MAATKIDLSGPLFREDPEKRILANARLMLEDIAEWGEAKVREQIQARARSMPFYTGWTASRVRGRVESHAGKKWYRHAVVSIDTTGDSQSLAIRTMAAAAGIERRWHPFRKVASASRRAIKAADLTKGLN